MVFSIEDLPPMVAKLPKMKKRGNRVECAWIKKTNTGTHFIYLFIFCLFAQKLVNTPIINNDIDKLI